MRFSSVGVCIASWLALSSAAAVPELVERSKTKSPDAACTNGPTTRDCWTNGYSIATDFDKKFPTTGNTVTYNLELTNATCNPDGNGERLCLLINGQFPGPTIRATWGDTLVINVKNSLQDNGTSMHWHGVRQYHSPGQDGVNGITECPLAPGTSRTYSFLVTQYGTSWYHSHFSVQYGDGIWGTMIFDGPASANYDIDLGVYPVNDWIYTPAFEQYTAAFDSLQNGVAPPSADTILINGTNKDASGAGSYSQVSLTSGKKYRLRLINTSVDNNIRVSLDNHALQVITTDFVPIEPIYVNTLLISAGQRYDVIINANQTAGNYWFRADPATDCTSANNFYGRAIFSYSSVTLAQPASSGYTAPTDCAAPSPLTPYWKQAIPSSTFSTRVQTLDLEITDQTVADNESVVVWALGSTGMDISWTKPTMSYIFEGEANYTAGMRVLTTAAEGGWNYWVIQQDNFVPLPHPIHLHGHDYFVLGTGTGTFSAASDASSLNFATPTRRDTNLVPSGGWMALAFQSNNPGTWIMHCHIAWHVSEGLAVQFLEAPKKMTLPNEATYHTECANWAAYDATATYHKDDSGA